MLSPQKYANLEHSFIFSEIIIKFFNAFTVPPAEDVLLKPARLAIFSVKEPTQKQCKFLLFEFNLRFLIALALVKIKASNSSILIVSIAKGKIFKVGK